MHGITVTRMIEKMKLENKTPELDTDKTVLPHPEVNRPALQLAGFFEHFDSERVQIIGRVERAYVSTPAWCTVMEWSRMRMFWLWPSITVFLSWFPGRPLRTLWQS